MFKKPQQPEAPWTGATWEYLSITKSKTDDDLFTRYGQQGWELVAVTGAPPHNLRAFFKRPAPSSEVSKSTGGAQAAQ